MAGVSYGGSIVWWGYQVGGLWAGAPQAAKPPDGGQGVPYGEPVPRPAGHLAPAPYDLPAVWRGGNGATAAARPEAIWLWALTARRGDNSSSSMRDARRARESGSRGLFKFPATLAAPGASTLAPRATPRPLWSARDLRAAFSPAVCIALCGFAPLCLDRCIPPDRRRPSVLVAFVGALVDAPAAALVRHDASRSPVPRPVFPPGPAQAGATSRSASRRARCFRKNRISRAH